jgi:D-amino-acid oxidase
MATAVEETTPRGRQRERAIDRRRFLQVGGLAAIGWSASACAPRAARVGPRRPRLSLPSVEVSWDRVLRTTVGLRPHRPSGFVLRAEKLDEKLLIHNYGHGGAGISLSWGCAELATELALESTARRAAVLGCGAVGLATARRLQRAGFAVTIYAATLPPETTSNMALAAFTPTSGLVALDRRTPQWDAQFRRAARIAYEQLQLLVGEEYGISWLYNYTLTEDPRLASGRDLLWSDWRTERVVLEPGEHPFPSRYAVRTPSLRIEPPVYLRTMLRDVLLFGAGIVVRKFDTVRDVMTLPEPVLVNCTGLGSRGLFGDEELIPHKGQLTALVPQPEIDYMTTGGGRRIENLPGGGLHMMPRRDGIILGGTREVGVWDLDPNDEERRRIVEGHRQLFSAMRNPPAGARFTRAPRVDRIPPVESFFGLEY